MRNLLRGLVVPLLSAVMAAAPIAAAPTDAKAETETDAATFVAPYVQSDRRAVTEMLALAQVGPGDYLIDLGAGNGQIVFAAAARGAVGHGVELDEELVQRSRTKAETRGLATRTAFLHGDIFAADFSQATVVSLYLMPEVNLQLRPLLLQGLEPGSRVVSNAFDMGEWQPDQQEASSAGSTIYLWVIPAPVAGTWQFEVDNSAFSLQLRQRFQAVSARLQQGDDQQSVESTLLHGRSLQLAAQIAGAHYTFHGRVDGDRIEGFVQIQDGDGDRVERWRARRIAVAAD